jgi:hypothetical protein
MAMVGTSIAARRFPDVLGKIKQSGCEIRTSLIGGREETVGAPTERFGRQFGDPSERIACPPARSMKTKSVRQLSNDLPFASSDNLLHGIDHPTAGPHPHREELVHRVDLNPHLNPPAFDRRIERGALPSGSND